MSLLIVVVVVVLVVVVDINYLKNVDSRAVVYLTFHYNKGTQTSTSSGENVLEHPPDPRHTAEDCQTHTGICRLWNYRHIIDYWGIPCPSTMHDVTWNRKKRVADKHTMMMAFLCPHFKITKLTKIRDGFSQSVVMCTSVTLKGEILKTEFCQRGLQI